MRCKNCGWDNFDTNSKCEKCNASLKDSISENSYDESSSGGFNPNKTVREKDVFLDLSTENEANVCSECGYPLKENEKLCPNCGCSLQNNDNVNSNQTKPDFSFNNKSKTKTVPWWEMQGNTLSCSLKIIPRENEKVNQTEINFSGDEIILSRDNTEPANQTITSKEQAVLFQENNKWYIQDRSTLKTTYIHAGEKKELKSGDIIILGNRRFEFND